MEEIHGIFGEIFISAGGETGESETSAGVV